MSDLNTIERIPKKDDTNEIGRKDIHEKDINTSPYVHKKFGIKDNLYSDIQNINRSIYL